MGALSDKLQEAIDSQFSAGKKKIEQRVGIIVKNLRLGKDQGKSTQETLELIEKVSVGVATVTAVVKTVKSALASIEAAKTAAEAARKASVLSAGAANPAAAAIGIAQEFVIEKLDTEIEDTKDVLNVTPKLIENFETFMEDTKQKIEKAKKEKEEKDRYRKEQLRQLQSGLKDLKQEVEN